MAVGLWTATHLLAQKQRREQQFLRWAESLAVWRPAQVQNIAPLPEILQESSGLAHAAAGGYLTVNDSGNAADLYHLDPDGSVRARLKIPGLHAQDLEALDSGPCPQAWSSFDRCIYLFDTGDNLGIRSQLTVYALPDPTTTTTHRPVAMPIVFEKGARDIEAGSVDHNGYIWLVSKGRHGPVRLSRIAFRPADTPGFPIDVGVLLAQPARYHGTWFTGASIGQDAALYLRTYSAAFRYAPRPDGQGWQLDTPGYCFLGADDPQGEAVLALGSGQLLTSSESNSRGTGWLRKLACSWKPAPKQAWQ